MNLKFWSGLFQVTHPDGWVLGVFYMVIGAYLGGGLPTLLLPVVIRAAAVVGLMIAAGFAFNDYHDAFEDGINKPGRAIPSGRIPRLAALILSILLAVAVVALAFSLPPGLLLLAVINMIMSVGYTLFLKNTPILGHLTVAYLNTTIILFGCMAVAVPTLVIWLVSLGGFFFTLAQETIMVVDDQAGDRLAGLRTTAIYFGTGTTIHLFRLFAFFALAAMAMPCILGLVSKLYLWALLPCTVLPILNAIRLVSPRYTEDTIRLSSKWILRSRALSVLPVILLGVIG
jgi:geranylgeranylglycerol-phosphate geranylgeranyltransferase